MNFQRKWIGHPDELRTQGEQVDWHNVTESKVRKSLDGNYLNVDLAIETLRSGQELRTPFAHYRCHKNEL